MPRNRVLTAAPGLPADIEAGVNHIMALSPEQKLTMAARLEQIGGENLEQMAAALRLYVRNGGDT